jgi:hypothetical protein
LATTSPNRLQEIAAERGVKLEVLIPQTIEETGSVLQTAIRLSVTPNAIQNWLKRNGYRVVTRQVASLEKVTPA